MLHHSCDGGLACTRALTAAPSPPHTPQPQVVVSGFDETLSKERFTAAEYARETAARKALDVAAGLLTGGSKPPPDVIIGADTASALGVGGLGGGGVQEQGRAVGGGRQAFEHTHTPQPCRW